MLLSWKQNKKEDLFNSVWDVKASFDLDYTSSAERSHFYDFVVVS